MTGTAKQLVQWLIGLIAQGVGDKLFEIVEHREKRSLSQNAYYWKMLAILSKKLGVSMARLHNLFLRECAEPQRIGGQIAMMTIPDTDEAENEALEAEMYHIKPTSGVIESVDGRMFRWYIVLKGSHDMRVDEFSALLDRLLDECKQQGIETLPPDEIERIRQYEREAERKKAQKDESH